MTPEPSMYGSGIYSETHTAEMVCAEKCSTCEEENKTCDAVWNEDFNTDDWGNVQDADVKCEKCNHTFSYTYEKDYENYDYEED